MESPRKPSELIFEVLNFSPGMQRCANNDVVDTHTRDLAKIIYHQATFAKKCGQIA